MQHDEPRRPGAARPSLLSSAPQAETNSKSILNDLDGGKKPPPAAASRAPAAPRGRKGVLWGGALLGLALLASAAVWMMDVQQEELNLALATTAEPAPAAAHAPAAAPEPMSPAAPAAEAVPVPETAPGNSADIAAALDAPSKAHAAANIEDATPAQREQSLREMLNAPVASAPVAKLAKASDSPAVKAQAKAPPARATAQAEAKQKSAAPKLAKATATAKPKDKPVKQAAPAPDSDVALLAALVAHTHATRAPKQPDPLSAKLKQCRQLGTKGAEQCRTRACSGAKDDPQCKPAVTLAKETAAP